MATTFTEERGLARVEATGSIAEAAGGIAVAVLAIVGLSRTDAGMLTAIAVIVLGAALLTEGGAIAAEFSRLMSLSGDTTMAGIEMGGGMLSEVVIGAGVLVLGVLALVGVSPGTLLPISLLAAGGLLVVAAPSVQRLNEIRLTTSSGLAETGRHLIQAASSTATGIQILAGLAAVVLGILALTSTGTAVTGISATYTLVGLLVLGTTIVISASAVTGNMLRLFRR
ncbi:MAG TPA: hypothetical protein VMH86_00670 [Rhizomicrobium sp.]|nr:hypothetical protein [Rhizomicrobium sp.]